MFAAGDTQGAKREDPLAVDEMSHHLANAPLALGIAKPRLFLGEATQHRGKVCRLCQQGLIYRQGIWTVQITGDVPCIVFREFSSVRLRYERVIHGDEATSEMSAVEHLP